MVCLGVRDKGGYFEIYFEIAVAEIAFEHSFYSVTEGSGMEICIISSDNVRAPILVTITLVGMSAQSKFLIREAPPLQSSCF